MLVQNGYTSDELFHFVGRKTPQDHERNYQILLKILKSGCISYDPRHPGWGVVKLNFNLDRDLASEELIVPSVVCFCDIPLNQLGYHMTKYGQFGLSFPRSLLIKYGARPVTYVPFDREDKHSGYGRSFLQDLTCIYRSFCKQVVDKLPTGTGEEREEESELSTAEEAIAAVNEVFRKDFLAFLKPFNADLSDDDPDNFYLEREWRKYQNFCFDPSQVHQVIVAKAYVSRLQRDLPAYGEKVVSADSPTKRAP